MEAYALRYGEHRKYPTDLSDDKWRCIRPHLPSPTEDKDAPGFMAYGLSSMPSSTCSRAVARGGCCRGTSRLGKPSTSGSGDGAEVTCAGRGEG